MSSLKHYALERIAANFRVITVANGFSTDVTGVTRELANALTMPGTTIFLGEPPEQKLEDVSQSKTEVLLPVRAEAWRPWDGDSPGVDGTRLLRDMEWCVLNDPDLAGLAIDVQLRGNEILLADREKRIGVALDFLVHLRHDRSASQVAAPSLPASAVPSGALGASIRESWMADLVAAVEAVPSVVHVSRTDVSMRRLGAPGVVIPEPEETKRISICGLYECSAIVTLRIAVDKDGDSPNAELDAVAAAVEDAVIADRRRSGNASNTKILTSAAEVTTINRRLTTFIEAEFRYRHSAKDPTSRLASI